MDIFGGRESAYDSVKRVASETVGGFSKRELLEACPNLGASAAETALKRLCNEGFLRKIGAGRNTRYVVT